MNQIAVAFATGTRSIPLTPEIMDTMTKYFELKDGIYHFSDEKQRKMLDTIWDK